ncbi:MAG TPA: hypothetical protein VMW35_02685 [Myxococcota bacterium]|nr:hypothetical protein [Myxococcota bacterium]
MPAFPDARNVRHFRVTAWSGFGGTMDRLLILLGVLSASSSHAAAPGLACSVHPPGGTPASAYTRLAKVSRAEAERAALLELHAASPEIVDGKLALERGCLVYALGARLGSPARSEEILVDAGNAKLLSHEPAREKREARVRSQKDAPQAM